MKRKIIEINSEKCNGCGLCAEACHEGAIGIVGGKAVLLRDDYCDGLGNCLPVCHAGAITFIEREAADYDQAAVSRHMQNNIHQTGCPGSRPHSFQGRSTHAGALRSGNGAELPVDDLPDPVLAPIPDGQAVISELRQWPVQIRLAPLKAPYFEEADLLIAADCAAYARANFHAEFMSGKITLIGCPKLDDVDYSEKLTGIISDNNCKSLTVVRMEVPCCSGIEQATAAALKKSGKRIPFRVVTLTTEGNIL